MDQVLKQLGIELISSAPYHPQSDAKLEVFSQIPQTHLTEAM